LRPEGPRHLAALQENLYLIMKKPRSPERGLVSAGA
jgi:hypothetical protein